MVIIMISVKIDNVVVPVERPFEWTRDGTEEYDVGEIVITNSTKKTAYPDYAIVDVDTKRFILSGDEVKRLGQGLYEHNISLKEEVYILKSIVCPDRKYTTWDGARVTWKYIVEDLLTSYDLNTTTYYTLDTATQTLLNTDADFIEMVGGTLLDRLTPIFRAKNAVPTLTNGVIGHTDLGAVGDEISATLKTKLDNDKVEQYQVFSNISDYGSEVYTKAKNAVYESDEDVTSIFPFVGGYVTPRSTTNKYEDSNAQLECDSTIREVKHLWHKVTLDYTPFNEGAFGSVGDLPTNPDNGDYYTCDTNGYTSAVSGETYNSGDTAIWVYNAWFTNETSAPTELDFVIDFAEFNYTKNDWDKLEIETTFNTLKQGKYQNNTFYISDNIIGNLGVVYPNSVGLDRTAYETMMNSFESNALYGTELLGVVEQDLVNTEWQWEYVAKRDVDFIQTRHQSDKVIKKVTITNQQSDSEVELSRLGRASQSKVNRIGNDNFEVTVLYDDILDIESIFNYYNGYTITQIKILERFGQYTVTYKFVKNNAPLRINEAVTNTKDRFTITNRQVHTNFIKQYHVLFSTTQLTEDSGLPSDFKQRLFNAYTYQSSLDKPIKTAVYESVSSTPTYIGMSVQTGVEGNTLSYNAQFLSPTVAGAQLVEVTGISTLSRKRVNVNYTDEYGQVNNYKIHWSYDVTAFDANDYPVVTNFTRIFGNVNRDIRLNPDEILADTTCINLSTLNENLFVYGNIALNSSLYKELGGSSNFTIYYYDDTNLFHTKSDELNNDWQGIGSFTLNTTTGVWGITVPTGKSWAIASGNDVYMAYNNQGEDITTIYTNLMKENPNLGGI